MNYEDDILIEDSQLDVEWLEQPRRMRDYCRLSAEAQRTLGLAKENLDFVRSTIERAVRADPPRYGVVPGPRGITEDSIKSAIQIHEEYRIASRAVIDAQYEHDVAAGTVRAFDQRKSALENLVRLLGQSYFAGPSVPRNLSEERAQRDRDVQRKIRIGRGTTVTPDGAFSVGPVVHVPVNLGQHEAKKPVMRRRS